MSNKQFQSNLTKRSGRGAQGRETVDTKPAPWTLVVSKGIVLPIFPTKRSLPSIKSHLTSSHDTRDYLESGLGLVILVRYDITPVGSYDELLLVPGAFKQRPVTSQSPEQPRKGERLCDRRIPRIYVSSEKSLRNGRQNWGIRKELANFEWIETKGWFTTSQRVIVRDPTSQQVILDATFKSLPFFVPIVLDWLGKLIPSLVERNIDAEGLSVGDDEWLQTRIGGFGWCQPCWLSKCEDVPAPQRFFPRLTDIHAMLGVQLKGNLVFNSPKKLLPPDTAPIR